MADHIKLSDLQVRLARLAKYTGIELLDLQPAADLRKAAMRLQTLNEQPCNGIPRWNEKAKMVLSEWNESDEKRNDAATERARDKARKAVAELFGENWAQYLELEFQRDPRGAAIKINLKGENAGKSNAMGI